jgi:hypothetical protein
MSERKSTAGREGFKLITDQDLLNGVEARARQLEAERANHMLNKTEAEAVGDDAAMEALGDVIGQLEARLKVVHERRDTLKANMPKADAKSATPPQ